MDNEQLHFEFVTAAILSEREYALNAIVMMQDYENEQSRVRNEQLPHNGGDSAYTAVYSDYPKSNPLRYCLRGRHHRVKSHMVKLPRLVGRILK